MEAQEIFNTVARHLLTQGEKSMVGDKELYGEMCVYRGPRGLKCAAGVLMTDEEAAECGEQWAWHSAITAAQLEVVNRIGHSGLVAQLQRVHDNADPGYWKGELREVAAQFGLSAAVLDEFEE